MKIINKILSTNHLLRKLFQVKSGSTLSKQFFCKKHFLQVLVKAEKLQVVTSSLSEVIDKLFSEVIVFSTLFWLKIEIANNFQSMKKDKVHLKNWNSERVDKTGSLSQQLQKEFSSSLKLHLNLCFLGDLEDNTT